MPYSTNTFEIVQPYLAIPPPNIKKELISNQLTLVTVNPSLNSFDIKEYNSFTL